MWDNKFSGEKLKPKISIIVLTYNRAHLLRQCLVSLIGQSYSHDNYEIIVIDDGSKDDTKKIAQGFKSAISYYRQSHRGISAASNEGIRKSKANLIAFFSDDCFADKNWLKELSKIKLEGDIVGGGGRLLIKNPKNLFEKFSSYNLYGDSQNWQPTKYQPPFLSTGNAIFIRKKIIEVGLLDEKLKWGVDLDLGWRLYFKGYKFDFNPKAIVYHIPPKNYFAIFKKNFKYGQWNAIVSKKHKDKLNLYFNSSGEKLSPQSRDVPYLIRKMHQMADIFFEIGFRWQSHLSNRK